jgi:hypothetical protein
MKDLTKMKDFYRKYYTTEILEKIEKFGFDEECSFHSIDCYDPFDLDADVVAIPTPKEFFDWLLGKYNFYISIIPEDDYKHGVVFRYNIYKRDYDDHFNLKLTKSDFRTHDEAVENSVYDLLMNFEPK